MEVENIRPVQISFVPSYEGAGRSEPTEPYNVVHTLRLGIFRCHDLPPTPLSFPRCVPLVAGARCSKKEWVEDE